MAPATGTAISGGEAIVRSLERHGVDVVFGIPGEHNLEIYRALAGSPIRHVAPRHEQGAGFMADAYARVSGRPGVCVVVTGPGVTNLATPMAQAYTDSVPLLVISGQIRSEWIATGGGHFHELKDQLGLTAAVLSRSERVGDAGAAPAAIDRAMAELRSGRSRAVHLEFPQDVLGSTAVVEFRPVEEAPPLAPDPAAVGRAAGLLLASARPAIVVGGGGREAGPAVLSVAERLGAPVLTTWRGAGAVPNGHPLVVGAGVEQSAARSCLESCDAVLIVGSELSQVDFWPTFPAVGGPVIQIDRDAAAIGRRCAVEAAIVGDATLSLAALQRALGGSAPDPRPGRERAAALRAALDREAAGHAAPYRPLVEALRAALPADAILACDLTGPVYWAVPRFFPVDRPNQVLLSGIGTLGYALPAAIGAKVARPDRQVAAIAGDGGFMFTAPELLTAGQLGLSLVVVVWNNRGYGDIRRQLAASGVQPVGVDLVSPDFVQLAEACGAVGHRLTDVAALPELVRAAAERPRPTLIEVVAADV